MATSSNRCASASDGASRRSTGASDSDTSPSPSESPQTKRKKRQRHTDSKYQHELSIKYRGIKPSKKGSTYAFCSLCDVDISITGGGVHQIKRHCANKKHCSRVQEVSSQPTISTAECSQAEATKLSDQVCCAELCFARFVVEHNMPFAVADHFNCLVPVMFPDSKIAAEFACARTKIAALITHALAPAANEPVLTALLTQPFTILCNGGNDNFEKKYFGIMVRFWDEQIRKVGTRFLDAPVCNIATGETLFNALASCA